MADTDPGGNIPFAGDVFMNGEKLKPRPRAIMQR
jgi:hypothetical protein